MEITVTAASRPQKRCGGSTNIITLFLYMLRRKSTRGKAKSFNSSPLDMAADGKWQRLVGSMRPMHVQRSLSPPPPAEQPGGLSPPPPAHHPGGMSPAVWSETTEDVFTPPLSPWVDVMSTPATSASSSSGYSSPAVIHHELGLCEAEERVMEENECCENDDDGDEMIDAKAEEFIAKFYEQMRLQKL